MCVLRLVQPATLGGRAWAFFLIMALVGVYLGSSGAGRRAAGRLWTLPGA